MYLCNTDGHPRIRGRQRQVIDNIAGVPSAGIGPIIRIGVLITDDCSLSDVVKVLAKTCERFGAKERDANDENKLNVTIIADRSGFLFRGNSSIPIWCEAVGDVNPDDFHYFVVPELSPDAFTLQPGIIPPWVQLGGEAKLIRLSLDAGNVSNAGENFERSMEEAKQSPRTEPIHADRRKVLQIVMDAVRPGEAGKSSRTDQRRRARPDAPAPNERIKATIEWLNDNYGSRISIKKMAERALMSERNFLRRFKAEAGRSPHEYLCQVRLDSARQLLLNTALPVDKIARHCGLFNGDHLRKHFLKRFEMTPGEYRAAHWHAKRSPGDTQAD